MMFHDIKSIFHLAPGLSKSRPLLCRLSAPRSPQPRLVRIDRFARSHAPAALMGRHAPRGPVEGGLRGHGEALEIAGEQQ